MMKFEGVRKQWDRYKYAILVGMIGVSLLLWPSGRNERIPETQTFTQRSQDLQRELEEILSTMSGVGQARVLLTVDSDGERQLAQDTELMYSGDTASPEEYSKRSETILVDGASGDETVVTKTVYPTYRGALVVCQGGDRPEIQLKVTKAVTALTGLSADRVTVAKSQ